MIAKKIVIYCRYSSDMQRPESCGDQERAVRTALARAGIVSDESDDIVVIHDEAESGTHAKRDGFRQLRDMIAEGKVAILAVDDQSRLSRASNAYAFVKDLVYADGRFISTGEGIDTIANGWELKVEILQLHHGQTIRDLRHRVHRGQQGRVEADGSAGDFPYGYESYYLDANWAEQLARRGPKPKKGVKICQEEATHVRQVFSWFAEGRSIGWIARELTQRNVPKGRRATTLGWHPEQVHRLLSNPKYIGRWVWGQTTTQRDSQGRKKQIKVQAGHEVVRDRPELRIITQDMWDRAVVLFAELKDTFGQKPGQKRRGPKANPAERYPRSALGGLLACSKCAAKMWQQQSTKRRFYYCPSVKKGLCDMTTHVPADHAEKLLTTFLLDLLRGCPEWMQVLYQSTCNAIREIALRAPEERMRDERRSVELQRVIDNLVNVLALGSQESPAIVTRLRKAETEKAEINARLTRNSRTTVETLKLPDVEWVARHLSEWVAQKTSEESPTSLLHLAIKSIAAEPVIAPGKKRGFIRLRFRVNSWAILESVLTKSIPSAVLESLPKRDDDHDEPEFTLDLGELTAMDRWAPQIVAWRAEGVIWEEIVRRTGMDLNRVFVAWKRHTDAMGATPPAA